MNISESKPSVPWLMLVSRTLLFAVFQLLIAGALAVTGSSVPWGDSAGWWMLSALLANLVSITLLIWLHHREGRRYFDFIHFSRLTMWKDIGIAILMMIVIVPLATYPNQWLANLLFGSNEAVFSLLFRPLPLWAGLVSILFPVTIAFAELPTYFGYVMPRLEGQLGNSWSAWVLTSLFLAFQHITLPLIFDWRFMLWRLGMFIPIAFFMGLCLKLRPQLFSYLMVGHALLDMSTVLIILTL
ncbi:MAG TPA: hypothetical protein VK897_18300 [Anaerolineales bacterium]|nr:hypothetical protein [Anaerolineales bacterium]